MSFDLTVHRRNSKSTKVESEDAYRCAIRGDTKYFERPKGSGKFFYENGEVVAPDKCPKLTAPVIKPGSVEEIAHLKAELTKATSALMKKEEDEAKLKVEEKSAKPVKA